MLRVLALGFLVTAACAGASADWPCWRGPQGTPLRSPPLISALPAGGLKVQWKAEGIPSEKASGYGSPVIAGGSVYLLTNRKASEQTEDVIFCLDAATGATRWTKALPGRACEYGTSSTPCVVANRIYLALSDNSVACLDTKDGNVLWKIPGTKPNISASCLHHDGVIYIHAGVLMALKADSGAEVWTRKDIGGINLTPALWRHASGTYLLCGGKFLQCLDPKTGKTLWKAPGGGGDVTPAIDGDLVAVQNGKGMLIYRMSPSAAALVVQTEEGGSRGGSLTAQAGRIYSPGGPKAVCIDGSTGKVVWNVTGGSEEFSCAIVADGKLLAVTKTGDLLALDAGTGATLFTATGIAARRCASPAFADGRLVLRCKNAVQCFDLRQ